MATTDIVQLFSLPMEIGGLFITITEVFFKTTNQVSEIRFSKIVGGADRLWYRYNSVAACSIFALVGLTFCYWIARDIFPGALRFPDLVEMIIAVTFFEGLWFMIIFWFFQTALQRTRPLLTLGLTLSTLGLIGEMYQVSKIEF